ncbi:MAG: M23 family metallopeptidase [Polyangiaceae bacterium]|nr:M23 family metallopeptidase [Polyangiaceae bacterium]
MYERFHPSKAASRASIAEQFGVRGVRQLARDLGTILSHMASSSAPPVDPTVVGHFRPSMSLPAYAGLKPVSGIAPIMNFFDRAGGGRGFRRIVTKRTARDWRGGRLTYDEHDGTDFVCPPRTPIVAAAPGVLVATRDSFLRGGLTACVDHGGGVVTQYTHLTRVVAEIGQPLARGEVLAWSGTGGLDMVSGFPWVPPHVHFMAWVDGMPVDPYRLPDDAAQRVRWLHGNDPETSGERTSDVRPRTLADVSVDEAAVERGVASCKSSAIRAELERATHPATRLAIFEDSLHHDRDAWPDGLFGTRMRPAAGEIVQLTLPLPIAGYRAARAHDGMFSKPRQPR